MPTITDLDLKVLLEYCASITDLAAKLKGASTHYDQQHALIDLEFYIALADIRIRKIKGEDK